MAIVNAMGTRPLKTSLWSEVCESIVRQQAVPCTDKHKSQLAAQTTQTHTHNHTHSHTHTSVLHSTTPGAHPLHSLTTLTGHTTFHSEEDGTRTDQHLHQQTWWHSFNPGNFHE